jgi:hypothetical protein
MEGQHAGRQGKGSAHLDHREYQGFDLPHGSLPLMYGLTTLATNEDASQLVAITYEGRLFSRPTDDPAAPWTEHPKIPRVRDF